MILESKGLIFKTKKTARFIKSHAWVPTPLKINGEVFRVFYAGRDKSNQSSIYSFDYNFKKKAVTKFSKKPVLKKGRLGCFDDCAAIPSHAVLINKKIFLYYIGWTRGVSVPYISSLGLAISIKNNNFKRFSEAPIIGRSKNDPIFTASCFVEKTGKKFKMIYTSNKSWNFNKFFVPNYNLKYAFSKDGKEWNTTPNFIILNKSKKEIAITRPWLITINNKKVLFYSYKNYSNKGRNYKIGFALKKNKKWVRKDNITFKKSKDKFDNQMQEYGALIKYEKKIFMFYNGNNYGEEGVGLAELKY